MILNRSPIVMGESYMSRKAAEVWGLQASIYSGCGKELLQAHELPFPHLCEALPFDGKSNTAHIGGDRIIMNTSLNKPKREFLVEIADLLENARKTVKANVNLTMVYTYFEIGRRIVVEEQNGADRAEYGKNCCMNCLHFSQQNSERVFPSET